MLLQYVRGALRNLFVCFLASIVGVAACEGPPPEDEQEEGAESAVDVTRSALAVDGFDDANIAAWRPFHGGASTITQTVVAGTSGQAMRLGYTVSPGGYAGVERTT